jgi:hypothetical protein
MRSPDRNSHHFELSRQEIVSATQQQSADKVWQLNRWVHDHGPAAYLQQYISADGNTMHYDVLIDSEQWTGERSHLHEYLERKLGGWPSVGREGGPPYE